MLPACWNVGHFPRQFHLYHQRIFIPYCKLWCRFSFRLNYTAGSKLAAVFFSLLVFFFCEQGGAVGRWEWQSVAVRKFHYEKHTRARATIMRKRYILMWGRLHNFYGRLRRRRRRDDRQLWTVVMKEEDAARKAQLKTIEMCFSSKDEFSSVALNVCCSNPRQFA